MAKLRWLWHKFGEALVVTAMMSMIGRLGDE